MKSQRGRINHPNPDAVLRLYSVSGEDSFSNRENQPFQQEHGLISMWGYHLPTTEKNEEGRKFYREIYHDYPVVLHSIPLYIHTIKIIIYNYIITISEVNWTLRWTRREALPHNICVSRRKHPTGINFASYSLVDCNLTSLYLKPLCNRETAMSKSLAVYSNLSEVPP